MSAYLDNLRKVGTLPEGRDRFPEVLPPDQILPPRKIPPALPALPQPKGSYLDRLRSKAATTPEGVEVLPPERPPERPILSPPSHAGQLLREGGEMVAWSAGAIGGATLGGFTGPGAPITIPLLSAAGAGTAKATYQALMRSLGIHDPGDEGEWRNFAEGAGWDLGMGMLGPAVKQLGPLLKKPGSLIEKYFSEPVLTQLKKFVNWKVLPSHEEALFHGKMQPYAVRKSIADVFQSGLERLPKKQASVIRENIAIKSNVQRAGEILGKEISTLNPQARLEIMSKGLDAKALDPYASGLTLSEAKARFRAREVVKKFEGSMTDFGLTQTQADEVLGKVSKSLSAFLTSPQGQLTNPGIVQPLMQIIKNAQKTSISGIKGRWNNLIEGPLQSSLRALAVDPATSPSLKALARDLHDLPVVIPENVAKSVRAIMHTDLKATLKGMGGMVLKLPPASGTKNYLPSKTFVEKGNAQWVRRDVELTLRAMEDVPKAAHQIVNRWFMSPWKTAKVILNPAANVRNDLTNIMQSHMNGLPFWDMKTYRDAWRSYRGGDITSMYGKSATPETFQRFTGVGGTFSANDIAQKSKGMLTNATAFDEVLALHDKVVEPARQFYSAQEGFFKYANYINNLKTKGMKPKDAAQDAVDALFNYGEITRATARLRSNLMPFITWQTKIFPQMVDKVFRNPVKAVSLIYLYHAMQEQSLKNLNMSDVEAEAFLGALPKYMQDGLMFPLPYRDQEGRVQLLDLTYLIPGIGDAYQVSNNPLNFILSNPLLGISSMLLSKTKFSGAPLYNEWDPPQVKVGKSIGAIWESITPSLTPGGLDWNRWASSISGAYYEGKGRPRTEKELTLPQAAAAQVGFRVVPKDIGETFRKHQALGKIYKSEIEQAFARDFKAAKTQSDVDELLKKYQKELNWLRGEQQLNGP